MTELLQNPAVQAAVLPFLVASLAIFLAGRTAQSKAGIGLLAGFLVCVLLTTGIDLTPLTSTRKIMIMVAVLWFLGMLADRWIHAHYSRGWMQAVSFMLVALAVFWVVESYVLRASTDWIVRLKIAGLGSVSLLGILLAERRSERNVSGLVTGFAAASIAVLVTSSALLGQWLASFSAALFAVAVLAYLVMGQKKMGFACLWPTAFAFGTLLMAAGVFSRLPTASWFFLALVPWITLLGGRQSGRVSSMIVAAVIACIPAGVAVWLAWSSSSGMLY